MKEEDPLEQRRRPATTPKPEKLRKELKRLNLVLPITAAALLLCIGILIIRGYSTLICALSGLLAIRLLFHVLLRHETQEQLKRAEELEEQERV